MALGKPANVLELRVSGMILNGCKKETLPDPRNRQEKENLIKIHGCPAAMKMQIRLYTIYMYWQLQVFPSSLGN